MKSSTCCFSGHRPGKIKWEGKENSPEYCAVISRTKTEIENAIQKGYTSFITGMAIGYDTSCAELVLFFKQKYPRIKLICALPCKEQDKFWRESDKLKYKTILKKADRIIYTSNEYSANCMQKRNEFMLENSSLLIAFFNGSGGGTKMTVEKAKELHLETRIIN